MGSSILDYDTLIEILFHLPEKSLCRFKCVSKQWCSIIHDVIYPIRLPGTVIGIFHHDDEYVKLPTLSVVGTRSIWIRQIEQKCNFVGSSSQGCHGASFLSFLPCYDELLMLDCCNGLLLCRSNYNYRTIYVCNPANKRWRSLPELPVAPDNCLYLFVLAFDPSVSPHYKVIRFVKCSWHLKAIVFDVFDSRTCKWSEPKPFPATHIRDLKRGTFLGGALYLYSEQHDIVKFDTSEWNCHLMKLPIEALGHPQSMAIYPRSLLFAACNGSLLTVWILKDCFTSGWTLKHCTTLEALTNKYLQEVYPPPTKGMLHLLAFHPYLEVVFFKIGLKIFSYDLNSLIFENPFNLKHESLSSELETFIRSYGVFPYAPCLIDSLEDADTGKST